MINRLKLITLFVALLGIVSCSDDDGSAGTNNNLTGTWAPVALTMDGTASFDVQGQSVTADFDGVATDFNDTTITFNDDGTFTSAGSEITVEMTLNFLGQSITQEMPAPVAITEGTWEINGNTFILSSSEQEPQEYNIIELTDTTFHFAGENSEMMDGSEATVQLDMTLNRM